MPRNMLWTRLSPFEPPPVEASALISGCPSNALAGAFTAFTMVCAALASAVAYASALALSACTNWSWKAVIICRLSC
ncbi:Uncharacterised protein [Mycobacterium tuberculosis]|nr:Uncharacterised protein [Mycobacterium tuberculosis]CNW77581.1 Uncharacterised protein [Mycobacterium tuberculosis]